MIRLNGMRYTRIGAQHVGRGPWPLGAGQAACARCGIVRTVNESREVKPLCQDCADVEADLAAATTIRRPECGELRGYFQHRKHEESVCSECRIAMRDYRRARRAAGRAA